MRVFASLFLATLSGCAIAPGFERPALAPAVPDTWTGAIVPAGAKPTPWLAEFGDSAGLTALVTEAMAHNFDLQTARAKARAARARARIAGADELPAVEMSASAARSKRAGTNGTSGNIADSLDLEGEASFTLDVWGALDSATRAAVAEAEAAQADYQAARLRLAADVARAWLEAIEAGQQLALAEKTVASFEDSYRTVQEQYRAGIGDALDVHLAHENLATARSRLKGRARERDGQVRTLEALLGRYPAATVALPEMLPALQHTVPVGLPSELLSRRPDLRAAEYRLAAAERRLDEARVNRLPQIRLTASGGASSSELRHLLDWDAMVWSLLGSLTQPIFQGGRLAAEVKLAEADGQEQFAAYAQAVLNAFREVETALAAEVLLAGQEAALQTATREADEAARLALARYRQGLSNIVTLLEAQRRAFTSESSLLETKRQRLQARVDLYLALGGDFAESAETAKGGAPLTQVSAP